MTRDTYIRQWHGKHGMLRYVLAMMDAHRRLNLCFITIKTCAAKSVYLIPAVWKNIFSFH